MEELTFESIQQNLVEVEQHDEVLHFVFRCPATGVEVESVLDTEGVEFGQDDLPGAALQAFQAVSSSFHWDGRRWIWWEANDAVREFLDLVTRFPARTAHDRDVLGRMLVEVAQADEQVNEQELAFIREMFPEILTPQGELLPLEPLAVDELEDVKSRRVRQTLWMLAYALALCDEELATEEEAILDDFADAFLLPGLRSWELKRYAQYFVVDQAVARAYRDGELTPEERASTMRLAVRVGLEIEEAQDIEIRYRVRAGLD